MIAGSIRTVASHWKPSGSGIRNSTVPGSTAFDQRVAALKGLKKVAGGSATAVPPDKSSPTRPEPRQGFQRARHHASLNVTCPHQAALGRPYNRFSTCWSKGHRPAESPAKRHPKPRRAHTTGTRTPNPRTHRHPAERAQNQRRGGADLRVRSHAHPTENPRPNGQRTRLSRKRPRSSNPKTPRDRPFTDTRQAP